MYSSMKFIDMDGFWKYSDREEQKRFTEARSIWRKQKLEELESDPVKYEENESQLNNDWDAYGPC